MGSSEFFKEVEKVQQDITSISENTTLIEQYHKKIISENNANVISGLQAQLDSCQESTSGLISEVRVLIKKLQASSEQGSDSEVSVKKAQVSGATKKLMQVARKYQEVQMHYKEQYRNRLKREYKVANPSATSEELEQAADSQSNAFMMKMNSTSLEKSKRICKDMQSRHEEILKIEESVTELYNLFIEMQQILETQQEGINFIEEHVDNAATTIKTGNEEMEKAIKHKKRHRKFSRYLCLCATLAIIAGGIILYIYVIKPIFIDNRNRAPPRPQVPVQPQPVPPNVNPP